MFSVFYCFYVFSLFFGARRRQYNLLSEDAMSAHIVKELFASMSYLAISAYVGSRACWRPWSTRVCSRWL